MSNARRLTSAVRLRRCIYLEKEQKELALGPYRALDLTDEKGFFCGKLLGDLGVDVIKIEPPGGEPSRRIGPFYRDIPDPEKSLHWFAYNANKRGITLNIETVDGKEIFKRLVKKADFVIESFPPGYMEELGLGYSTLSKVNPGVIMTSITHFGQTGPYKDFRGCDIVDMALSGYMYMCGDPDRAPVRVSSPQAYAHGGVEAAAGTMIALYYRQLTGEGQWIDVSIRDSIIRAMYVIRIFWDLNRQTSRRAGVWRAEGGFARVRQGWACKEGAVSFRISGGAAGARVSQATVRWMDEEGMADEFLKTFNWEALDMVKVTQETVDAIEERVNRFFMTHTAAELYEGAKKRRIMLYPVTTPKDLAENTHLAARGFWEEVEHPELGTIITYPGAFVRATETPCNIRRRAPLIGEHNEEVYGELGLLGKELVTLKQANII